MKKKKVNKWGFCKVCGSKNIGESTGKYSEVTGKKLGRPLCPVGGCNHSGHLWEHDFTYCRASFTCKRCGFFDDQRMEMYRGL